MMALVATELAQEEQDADDKDDEHLPELYEFQLGQEGNPDTIDDGDPTAKVVNTVIVNVKKTNLAELKDLIKKFQIPMPHDKRKQQLISVI